MNLLERTLLKYIKNKLIHFIENFLQNEWSLFSQFLYRNFSILF